MRHGPDYGVPPRLAHLLGLADPSEDGEGVVFGQDLLSRSQYSPGELRRLGAELDALLADETIGKAELKGILNRSMGKAWGVPFSFRGPREFLEAVAKQLRTQ